ncbi:hypothetical protein CY0110_17207 [Crocosphaera chwakensis CCY0110]|uniref:Uncharacterized protein n=1 Tax=Crocosphaera chwakensis CCY0110 TaxID=391612 RepID=A3IIC3_9CHRO|nr:hypothetical protein CY0110_17207 [Crocosphaera chwakensis CCY0110]
MSKTHPFFFDKIAVIFFSRSTPYYLQIIII